MNFAYSSAARLCRNRSFDRGLRLCQGYGATGDADRANATEGPTPKAFARHGGQAERASREAPSIKQQKQFDYDYEHDYEF